MRAADREGKGPPAGHAAVISALSVHSQHTTMCSWLSLASLGHQLVMKPHNFTCFLLTATCADIALHTEAVLAPGISSFDFLAEGTRIERPVHEKL
jgi:hypothetical protein